MAVSYGETSDELLISNNFLFDSLEETEIKYDSRDMVHNMFSQASQKWWQVLCNTLNYDTEHGREGCRYCITWGYD